MTDQQKAFDAMEVYRTIMYSDASPVEMIAGLDAMTTKLENLVVDENVAAMVQGMFDQTLMRIQLILEHEDQKKFDAKLHAEVTARIGYLSRWSRNFLHSIRTKYEGDPETVRELVAKRAERKAWYE